MLVTTVKNNPNIFYLKPYVVFFVPYEQQEKSCHHFSAVIFTAPEDTDHRVYVIPLSSPYGVQKL